MLGYSGMNWNTGAIKTMIISALPGLVIPGLALLPRITPLCVPYCIKLDIETLIL